MTNSRRPAVGRRARPLRGLAVCVLVGACLAGMAACMVWSGCVTVPVGSTRRPLTTTKKEDFSIVQPGKTTRSELTRQFGQMNQYSPELRLGCYELNEVTRTRLLLAFCVLPAGTEKHSDERDMVYMEFDEADRVRRFTNTTTSTKLNDGAARWATEGHWHCLSATVNGERLPERTLSQLGVTLTKNKFRVKHKNDVLFDGHYDIKARETPIRFTMSEKGGPRRWASGVVSLQGDILEICYAVDRKYEQRLMTFESSPGTYWFVWKRQAK